MLDDNIKEILWEVIVEDVSVTGVVAGFVASEVLFLPLSVCTPSFSHAFIFFSIRVFQRMVRYAAFFWISAMLLGANGTGRCESQPGRRVGSKSLGMMTLNCGDLRAGFWPVIISVLLCADGRFLL